MGLLVGFDVNRMNEVDRRNANAILDLMAGTCDSEPPQPDNTSH